MIKLIAFDIDDTLTKEPRTVPQANLDAVKRAQDAGIFVTVATGRGFHGSSYIWQAMGVQGPIINYGGADNKRYRYRAKPFIPPSLTKDGKGAACTCKGA